MNLFKNNWRIKLFALLITGVLVVLANSSCTVEDNIIYNDINDVNNSEYFENEKAFGILFGGDYLRTVEHGLQCHMNGDYLNIYITGFDVDDLYIPGREPPMRCKHTDLGNIICKQHSVSDYFWWNETFYFDYNSTDDSLGTFTWENKVDGLEDLWCVYVFSIDEMTASY